jgi:hypothetical protein
VVDRTRLESGRTFTGTGSSNLPLSASFCVLLKLLNPYNAMRPEPVGRFFPIDSCTA